MTASYDAHVDKESPVLTANQSPPANANGWNNTDVTVSWSCNDDESGVDLSASELNDDVLAVSGSATAFCADLAGNTVTASYDVQIDRDAPTVDIAAPLPWSVNLIGMELSFGATDDLSGVASVVATLDDGSGPLAVEDGTAIDIAGVYRLAVTATDFAGNTATETVDFVVYDPAGGAVYGGGRFPSAPGALASEPDWSGGAFFVFQSQYKKGATIPTGNTRFWLQTNLFRFVSDTYE